MPTPTDFSITNLYKKIINAGGTETSRRPMLVRTLSSLVFRSDGTTVESSLSGIESTIGNLGTASTKDVPASGNASNTQVVMGNDSRLSDSRPASDVSSWAKASTKPTYTASEVGAASTTDLANGLAKRNTLFFAECSTAAATAAKTVTLADSTYTPVAGDLFLIYFQNKNTAKSPTLNINGKGAKTLRLVHTSGAYGGGRSNASVYYLIRFVGTDYHTVTTDIPYYSYLCENTVGVLNYAYPSGEQYMHFNWSAQSGQPEWLWGGNDSGFPEMHVYNPSNFSVDKAAKDGDGNTISSTYLKKTTAVTIVPFATGTDDQILAMIQAHYDNVIDLKLYWNVGDERTPSSSGNNSMLYNTQKTATTWVIVGFECDDLATPINGHTKAAVTLQTKKDVAQRLITPTNTWSGYWWANSTGRTWLNGTYYNAFTTTLKNNLKTIKYFLAGYDGQTSGSYTDNVTLPSATNVWGDTYVASADYAPTDVASEGDIYPYYRIAANRAKATTNGSWFTRTVCKTWSYRFIYCGSTGGIGWYDGNYSSGIPCLCPIICL